MVRLYTVSIIGNAYLNKIKRYECDVNGKRLLIISSICFFFLLLAQGYFMLFNIS